MAITYFGSSSQPEEDTEYLAKTATIAPVASMAAGDLVFVQFTARSTAANLSINTTGGQTWTPLIENYDATLQTRSNYYCRFNGTWDASPIFASSSLAIITATMHVFRPTAGSNTWAVDVAIVNSSINSTGSSPYTVTVPGITTLTNGALVITSVTNSNSRQVTGVTAGWSTLGPSLNYHNPSGSDINSSYVYLIDAAAGATGDLVFTYSGLTNGNSAMIIAFKEASSKIQKLYAKDSGDWKNISKVWARVSGTWVESGVSARVSGDWKTIHEK